MLKFAASDQVHGNPTHMLAIAHKKRRDEGRGVRWETLKLAGAYQGTVTIEVSIDSPMYALAFVACVSAVANAC